MNDNKKPGPGLPKGVALIGALAAIAAAIAAVAAFFGDGPMPSPPSPDNAEATDEEGAAPSFTAQESYPRLCYPDIVATEDGCIPEAFFSGEATFAEFAAGKDVRLTMAGPDGGGPRDVLGCDDFATLKARGWGALNGADMRRENHMAARCGLAMLAERADGTGKPVPELTTDTLRSLPAASLPGFGEAGFEGVAFSRESRSPDVWSISSETLRGEFQMIGTANFDDDLEAEHLVAWRLAAEGGTFADAGYGLVETADGEPSFRVIDPFAG